MITNPVTTPPAASADERLRVCLERLYGRAAVDDIHAHIMARLAQVHVPPNAGDFLTERSAMLITYGDTIYREGEPPLRTLHDFVRGRLQAIIDTVHILPFYPWQTDDGFSVKDYAAVDAALGTWADVERLSADFRLMFDAVINHMSQQGTWFADFKAGKPDFRGRFFIPPPNGDWSKVVRPRTSPLFHRVTLDSGQAVEVWTTFSEDQVDLDYRDPLTLLAILEVLLLYVSRGAQVLRLDAIAFMWKESATTCLHLPQTHALIKTIRAALDLVAPHVTIITETNVPHEENISYFGDGTDEAQLVYNFTLPPLLLHTLLSQDAGRLVGWINSLKVPSSRTAFLNFTASHDGIGLRPVEGILSTSEVEALVALAKARGGMVSERSSNAPGGKPVPYELNVTYLNACADPALPLEVQARQFLLTQGVMLTLAGVPAIYLHSLLGTPNDSEGMQRSQINRRINRAKLSLDTLIAELDAPGSLRAQVFAGYTAMLRARRGCRAFHPNGSQQAHSLNEGRVLRVERDAPARAASAGSARAVPPAERIVGLFNLSATPQTVDSVPAGTALITGEAVAGGTLTLAPYDFCWIRVVGPSH